MIGVPAEVARRAVRERAEEIIRLAQAIVRTPSVVGDEGPVQRVIAAWAQERGLDVVSFVADRNAVEREPSYVDAPWPTQGRPNLRVRLPHGRNGGRSLLLNGHVDVVSPEPVDAWTHDPWGGAIVDGRLYGRGACDMKGGLAAALGALAALRAAGLRPRAPLDVIAVVEEEGGGGAGTLACLRHGWTADAFVACEPQPRVALAHAGVLYFRIRVLGSAAHAGAGHTGVSAIAKMNLLHDALVELGERRARERHFELIEQGSGRSCHLNVGIFRAGDWPAMVPGWAEVEGRISFIPGESEDSVKADLRELVGTVADGDPWLREHPPAVEWFGMHANPWTQDAGHHLVRTFLGSVRDVTGREPEVIGKAAAMDTRFAGEAGIPALSYGVAGGGVHGPDEYAEVESIVECAEVLADFAARWCGMEPA